MASMPKNVEELRTSTVNLVSKLVPGAVKDLVPTELKARVAHSPSYEPEQLPRFDELQALMNDRYNVRNLKTVDRHQFKETIDAFHALEDASMEGYQSPEFQRARSIRFTWDYDHDFGDFKVGPGKDHFRPARLMARFMERFGTPEMDLSGKTVLDIGCYLGGMSLLMCAMGAKVVAIEEVKKYADCVKYMSDAFDIDLEVRNMSLYDMTSDEFQDAFDIVLLAGVLYHLSDPVIGMRITFDAVKPDGICLLETGAARSEERILEYGGKNQEGRNKGANWFFPSPLVVTEMMDEVGYTEVRGSVSHAPGRPRNRMVAVGTKVKQVDMLRAGLSVAKIR